MTKSVTFSLPDSVLELIEEVRRRRRDPTRSDTVRVLLLQALAAMSFVSASEKKALGIKNGGISRQTVRFKPSLRRIGQQPSGPSQREVKSIET